MRANLGTNRGRLMTDLYQPAAAQGFGQANVVRLKPHLFRREEGASPSHPCLNFISHEGDIPSTALLTEPLQECLWQWPDSAFSLDWFYESGDNPACCLLPSFFPVSGITWVKEADARSPLVKRLSVVRR
jgi:hypothetical protein